MARLVPFRVFTKWFVSVPFASLSLWLAFAQASHAVTGESVAVKDIISLLESTRIDGVVVEFTLYESITGEVPKELEAVRDPSVPSIPREPNSECELIYDRGTGARYTNFTNGLAHNVLDGSEVVVEINRYPQGSEEPWNVSHLATKRAAWKEPVVYSVAPVQMLMLWLDPLRTRLFQDLKNQSSISAPISIDPTHGEVVSITVAEQDCLLLLSKAANWRPVVVQKFRDGELASLTTFEYAKGEGGLLVADKISTERKTASGRDATYRIGVKRTKITNVVKDDIAIEYPAYTLLEQEDTSVPGGWRYFVSSISGSMRELASAEQMTQLDATRGWRKFADAGNGKAKMKWYVSGVIIALCFVAMFYLRRR